MMSVEGRKERKENRRIKEKPPPDRFGLVMAASPSDVQNHDAKAFRFM
jgi:hypothetical protein